MLRGAILAAAAAAAAAAATAAAMSNAGDDDTRRSTRTARRQRKRGDSAHRFGHRSGGGSVAVAIRRPTGCSGAATDRGGDGASRPSSPLAVPTAHRLQSLIDSRYRRHDHHHRRHTPSSYGIFRSGSGGRRGGGGATPPPPRPLRIRRSQARRLHQAQARAVPVPAPQRPPPLYAAGTEPRLWQAQA